MMLTYDVEHTGEVLRSGSGICCVLQRDISIVGRITKGYISNPEIRYGGLGFCIILHVLDGVDMQAIHLRPAEC